ncbi:MAG: peptide chain release factor N(5)-glutamine methyltransferase [Saprospiraceae bacterium]|nr:peptide chain release factor N(5)-glutamine methyltransferase [Saprospiraceae bacterium]
MHRLQASKEIEWNVAHTQFLIKSEFLKKKFIEGIDQKGFEKLIELIIKERRVDKPIQYIIHEAVFMELILYVDENVLIPRFETEELVDWITQEYKKQMEPLSVLDIGTGSGCIPIYLKRQFPHWNVYAFDISAEALRVAELNANKYSCKISWTQTDFLSEQVSDHLKVDLIISNPPYITPEETHQMDSHVFLHEPRLALFVPTEDPLIFYKKIIEFSVNHLSANGKIFCELNEFRMDEVVYLFNQSGFMVEIKKDLQNKNRMLKAWRC